MLKQVCYSRVFAGLVFVLVSGLLVPNAGLRADGGKPKILFSSANGWPSVDCQYRHSLISEGYHIGVGNYDSLNPDAANVLVLGMTSPDQYPFKGSAGKNVLDFVQNGGGLLIMMGYSGYGDFAPVLAGHEWLLAASGSAVGLGKSL